MDGLYRLASVKAALAICVAILAGSLVAPTGASDPAVMIVPGTSLGIVPRGGAAGGDAVYCNGCDIIGPRNLQGGGPGGANFDIGAGSTEDPSDLALNWDIGRCTLIYGGTKNLLAKFCPSGITFYKRPRFPGGWSWWSVHHYRKVRHAH